ncbi:MAG: S9 family peptidase [Syntrophobacteraceae bacterium]|nr:S9 family peptidase [Syntrophobacteraceae bacterium]
MKLALRAVWKREVKHIAWALNLVPFLVLVSVLIPFFPGNALSAEAVRAKSVQIPAEAFFRKPDRDHFRLSPDGLSVSCLASLRGRMNLRVQRLSGGPPRFVTTFGDRDLTYHLWKTNEILLFGKDIRGDESFHLFKVNADGSGLTDLTPFDGGRATLLDELPDDPDHVLITLSLAHQESADVHRLNIRSGSLEKVAGNNGRIVDWLADHSGRVRIALEKRGEKTVLLHRPHSDSAFQPVIEVDLEVTIKPLLFTFDNRNLYAASNMGRDKLALVVFDLDGGMEREKLFEHRDFDIQALSHSRKRKVLTHVSTLGWRTEHHFFDERSRDLHESWRRRLGGDEIEVVDTSADEQVALLRTSSDLSPGRYYIACGTSRIPVELAVVNPWLPSDQLRPMTPVVVTARDGLALHGYLTLPSPDHSAPFPAIVKVHGGPWQRDRWRYDAEVQFLANRGYAVLQLNFRGSTGYGRRFWKASFREWGRRMQDDLTDGVRWLIDRRIADSARIGLYGSSYGGYAALAGLSLTPELYACGVAVSAPADLCRLLGNVPARWKPFGSALYRMIGDPARDREALEAVSPAKRMDAIKAPLLIAHGKLDPRVSHEDALSLVKNLKKRGVLVRSLIFEDEGHWITGEANRIRFYLALEEFLNAYLKAGKPGGT